MPTFILPAKATIDKRYVGDPLPHPGMLECVQGTPTGFSDGTNVIRVRWGAHWVPAQPRKGEPGVRYQHLQGPLGRPFSFYLPKLDITKAATCIMG